MTEHSIKTYDIKWQRDVSNEFEVRGVFESATETGEGQIKGNCFTEAVNNFLKHVPDGEITYMQLVEATSND